MRINQNNIFDYYKIAIESLNLELKLFWQRSYFFGGFIAVIFIAYYNINSTTHMSSNSIQLLIMILGILFSLAWSLGNRGSKYWFESWECKIKECEKLMEIDFYHYWVRPQNKFWLYKARCYSVSKIAIYLSDLSVFAWIYLFIQKCCNILCIMNSEHILKIGVIVVLLFILVYLLFYKTRTEIPKEVNEDWKKSKIL